MKIQPLSQSKLFYKKWLYRIECVQSGANRIKYSGIDRVEHWCLHQPTKKNLWANPWDAGIDKQELYAFLLAVKPFLENKNLQIRTEGSHFNFYCNDLELVKKIDKKLSKWIKRISGPTSQEEIDFLQSNSSKKILCKQYPRNQYRYKILLNTNISENQKSNFYHWANNYGEQIHFTKSMSKWLTGESLWWSTQPYFYVENEKTLTMIVLYLGSNIKQIQEYILRGSVLIA